jgi:hypothetical protein
MAHTLLVSLTDEQWFEDGSACQSFSPGVCHIIPLISLVIATWEVSSFVW